MAAGICIWAALIGLALGANSIVFICRRDSCLAFCCEMWSRKATAKGGVNKASAHWTCGSTLSLFSRQHCAVSNIPKHPIFWEPLTAACAISSLVCLYSRPFLANHLSRLSIASKTDSPFKPSNLKGLVVNTKCVAEGYRSDPIQDTVQQR